MIKLSEDDMLRHEDAYAVSIKMNCMICMAFPEVVLQKENTRIWEQSSNPVPSNRVCLHLKHELECPHCEFGVEPAEVVRERYLIEPAFRDEILRRDDYTCQACGYKQVEKPPSIARRKKNETEADYLHRRFTSSLAGSNQAKALVVAHFSKRYGKETYDERHKKENARTLCVDCHNMETAKHQIKSWMKRMEECQWLNKLE